VTDHPQEDELALYASRDLDSGRLASIAHHLNTCGACRRCVTEFDHLQTILTSIPAEPDTADLAELRTAVMETLSQTANRQRILKWAVAATAAGVLVTGLLLHQTDRELVRRPDLPPVASAQHKPDMAPKPEAVIRSVRVVRRRQHRPTPGLTSIALTTTNGQAPLIKVTTSDPNVIILLPADSESQERTAFDE
jgi:hypothetical protein